MQAAVHSNPVWRFLYGEESSSGPVPGTGTHRRLSYELISGIVHTAPACMCWYWAIAPMLLGVQG